jgi:metal-responsive CopG/Arc/MetJ family transcriptional regulator
MKRRGIIKFTQIHVSIPVRVLEDLDETLGFTQSRSKLITTLIKAYLEGEDTSWGGFTERQLVAILMEKFKPFSSERLLLESLLQILSE